MGSIVLEQVRKIYPGDVAALKGIDLSIADGEFMVFVGPSGCGKTTLLRCIAGLEQISDGSVRIGDRPVAGLPPKARDIAMVFQSYALYPNMTVEENLGFGLELRKVPKAERRRRVLEAARLLKLEDYLERRPSALSGGQQQRVAMGRAIVREPQAFLMDEPLSNLDAKLRIAMRASLKQLHERIGVTTVYVTHDQVEAMTLGDRVAVFDGGVLQQAGTPQHLFERPENLFVAGFMGSPPMNLARAQLVRDQGPALVLGSHVLPLGATALTARPGLDRYLEREVIVGLRPSEISVPDPSRHQATVTVRVDVVEELGTERHLFFTLDAAGTSGVPGGGGGGAGSSLADEAGYALGENQVLWTAVLDARSRVAAGTTVELAVDTEQLHFFDPTSGRVVGERARRPAPAEQPEVRA